MALPVNRPHSEVVVSGYMADSSGTTPVYMCAPCKGFIRRFKSVLGAQAIGTANNVLTATIAGTAITHDTWTQLTSGSAAGDVVEVNCSSANFVNEGQAIIVTSDGGGTNTCPTHIYAIIEAH